MYESKAIITNIKAHSRASIKIKDEYYTVEYEEERAIPDVEGLDINAERKLLWDDCNTQVDNQVEDILKTFKK